MNYLSNLKPKKSDTAIFLGCGPSINGITDDFIYRVNKVDVWSLNNFLIHDIVPDFHHLEIKPEKNGKLMKTLRKLKTYEFVDTVWLFANNLVNPAYYLHDNWKNNFYFYEKQYRDSDNGYYTPYSDNRVCLSCSSDGVDANLTAIVDMMCKAGYKKVYFLGVDLFSSEYFWTYNPSYDRFNIAKIMQTDMDCRPIHLAHSTHKTAKFLKDFSEWNKLDYVNLSSQSLLKEYIKTESIDSFLCKV
tara:strand:+ start:2214 stop:2948 length:735 start_codon:yes stop_codon:yes gene_type:complete